MIFGRRTGRKKWRAAVNKDFKVFEGKSFKFSDVFESRKEARLKGEERKISGDAEEFRVTEKVFEKEGLENVYLLWIH